MAVSANQTLKIRNPAKRRSGPVAASKHLYSGTMTFVVPGTGGHTDVIATTVNKFRGIVIEEQDNSSGVLGDKTVETYIDGEYFFRGQSGFALTDVGKPVYAVDNYTLSLVSTDKPRVGTLSTFISATEVGVELDVQIP